MLIGETKRSMGILSSALSWICAGAPDGAGVVGTGSASREPNRHCQPA